MVQAAVSDRRATRHDVAAARERLRHLALVCGLSNARLRDDGAIIVHAEAPGYLPVGRYAARAASVVGSYVHVVTDDTVSSEFPYEPL